MNQCKTCGLPQFSGPMGYVGMVCQCWNVYRNSPEYAPNMQAGQHRTREFVPVDEATVRRIIREELAKLKA